MARVGEWTRRLKPSHRKEDRGASASHAWATPPWRSPRSPHLMWQVPGGLTWAPAPAKAGANLIPAGDSLSLLL